MRVGVVLGMLRERVRRRVVEEKVLKEAEGELALERLLVVAEGEGVNWGLVERWEEMVRGMEA